MELVIWLVGTTLTSGVLTTLIVKWFDRRKTNAEASKTEAEATDVLTKVWERSLEHVQKELEMQRQRVYDLEKKLEAAYEKINEQNIEIAQLKTLLGNRRKDDE